MAEIIFHDFASADSGADRNVCWNQTTYKSRLALNFKRLPYTTIWLAIELAIELKDEAQEYPQLQPYFASRGVLPRETKPEYTLPTIKIDEELINDSAVIARELEKRFPEPSLQLDAPEVAEVADLFGSTMRPLSIIIILQVVRKLTNPASSDYILKAVEGGYGKTIDELEREQGGEQAFELAKESFKEWDNILKRKGGPFVLGQEPSYADVWIMSALLGMRRCDEGIYRKIVTMFPAFDVLFEACRPWAERNDH